MKETKVEEYLRKQIEAVGGLCEKHVSPGRRAVPDRLITWPSGLIHLVETKAPGKKPREEQERDHDRRFRRRCHVWVLDSPMRIDAYMLRHQREYQGIGLQPSRL
jgi:hypothetical protein